MMISNIVKDTDGLNTFVCLQSQGAADLVFSKLFCAVVEILEAAEAS